MTWTTQQAQELIDDVRNIFPHAVSLATVVSLAVRVEPELLRTARLKLLPDVDVGAEADLWFSPLVQSENTLALVLFPEVEALLRQELAQNQTLLRDSWEVLKEVHKTLPPTIRLEEEIAWLALSDDPDAVSKIEKLLQQVIIAMVDERRRGLAHWAVRALPRLPVMARTSQNAQIIALCASVYTGRRSITTDEIRINLNEPALRWVMSTDNTPTISVGVRLLEKGIEFGDPSMFGAHVIDMPATHPLLVEVKWWEDASFRTEQVIWLYGQTQAVQINPESITAQRAYGSGTYGSGPYGGVPPITIQTVDGKIYALNPYGKDEHKDAQELFNLSEALYNSEQYKDALTTFEQAIDLDPTLALDPLYQQIKDALKSFTLTALSNGQKTESEDEGPPNKVDFAIITIREDEFEAVLQRFPAVEAQYGDSGRVYGICQVQTKTEKSCKIALVRSSEQGNDAAQQVTNDVIRDLDPQMLLVVGIAGGVPSEDFTLGDVIISTRIDNLNVSKRYEDDREEFDIRGGIHPSISEIATSLHLYMKELAGWNASTSIIMNRPTVKLSQFNTNKFKSKITSNADKDLIDWYKRIQSSIVSHFATTRAPIFRIGRVASSNMLIHNVDQLVQWLQTVPSILAIEMESTGVYQATQRILRQYPVMAIRGISDIIGFERDDQWTKYACQTAAAFAHAFVTAGIITPREGERTAIHTSQQDRQRDFFISYNNQDRQWAEWIAWALEEAGYSVFIQAWDFLPGENFVLNMQRAIEQSKRTIAVLSKDYLKARFTQPEWAAVLAKDPTGEHGILLPIRVGKCEPTGILQAIVYSDLTELGEAEARKQLLDNARRVPPQQRVEEVLQHRNKPPVSPVFPG
jgi:nucleoside phosphorylase